MEVMPAWSGSCAAEASAVLAMQRNAQKAAGGKFMRGECDVCGHEASWSCGLGDWRACYMMCHLYACINPVIRVRPPHRSTDYKLTLTATSV